MDSYDLPPVVGGNSYGFEQPRRSTSYKQLPTTTSFQRKQKRASSSLRRIHLPVQPQLTTQLAQLEQMNSEIDNLKSLQRRNQATFQKFKQQHRLKSAVGPRKLI